MDMIRDMILVRDICELSHLTSALCVAKLTRAEITPFVRSRIFSLSQLQDEQRMPSIIRSASLRAPSPRIKGMSDSLSTTGEEPSRSLDSRRTSGIPEDFQSRFL